MNIISDINNVAVTVPCVQTIGGFDGLHLGHQYLLQQVRDTARKRGMKSMVITFRHHPSFTLRPDKPVAILTTLEEKLHLLQQMDIDYTAVLDFTPQMSQMSARIFMEQVLKEKLCGQALLIGYDHHFGHSSHDSFADYQRYGTALGIEVVQALELPPSNGRHVSSSAIRSALAEGEVTLAQQMLGRPYSIEGIVTHGEGIGHKLGFPTANIEPSDPQKILPKHGAYAVKAFIEGQVFPAMLYIGNRPTFNNLNALRIEAHLLDFEGDIYGSRLRVEFVDFLRSEHHFSSPLDLEKQLHSDLHTVRDLIKNNN